MNYACPAWQFEADSHLLKFHYTQNKVLWVFYQDAYRPTICMWRSKFHTCTILLQNCAGRSNTKSLKNICS